MSGLVDRLRLALWDRKGAYQDTFRTPRAQLVLKDLARFCRAHETTFHPDARLHAVAEGRREVFLRIAEHLQLNSEELWTLYSGRGRPDKE